MNTKPDLRKSYQSKILSIDWQYYTFQVFGKLPTVEKEYLEQNPPNATQEGDPGEATLKLMDDMLKNDGLGR